MPHPKLRCCLPGYAPQCKFHLKNKKEVRVKGEKNPVTTDTTMPEKIFRKNKRKFVGGARNPDKEVGAKKPITSGLKNGSTTPYGKGRKIGKG